MTTFNSNQASNPYSRCTVGLSQIKSPTMYSDMFVGADDDVIRSMLQGSDSGFITTSGPSQQSRDRAQTKHGRDRAQTKLPPPPASRLDNLKKLVKQNANIQSPPELHYKVIENAQDAQQACILLSGYHSVSVMWEGVDVNRHGTLTWLIFGYLGSAVLFNITLCGPGVFKEGGLKTLLEARHPIKVIHDCSCISDILYHQYNVTLQLESVFDTHAADLVIQAKDSPHAATSKTLTECLIEYHDIPINVYRTRESIMRRESCVWLLATVPEDLLQATARIARYAVLLHTIMLNKLSEPLPNITQLYLNQRDTPHSPSPLSKKKQISKELANILLSSKYKQSVVKTEWNIPDSVLNPVYEQGDPELRFYSKPFKFDIKKATPGSLKIFSINPDSKPEEDDDDWEKHVQTVPSNFDSIFREPHTESVPTSFLDANAAPFISQHTHPGYSDTPADPPPPSPTTIFKVPEIFSDISYSSSHCSSVHSSPARKSSQPSTASSPPSSSSSFIPTQLSPPSSKHTNDRDLVNDNSEGQNHAEGDVCINSEEVKSDDQTKSLGGSGDKSESEESFDETSSSDDGVYITLGSVSPPPTIKAQRDPSLIGSKIVWPGETEHNSASYQGTVMCEELRDLVQEIREKKRPGTQIPSNAFVSTEEMRRHLEEERKGVSYRGREYWGCEESYHSNEGSKEEADTRSINSSDIEVIRILDKPLVTEGAAASRASSSSEDIIIQPRSAAPKPWTPALKPGPGRRPPGSGSRNGHGPCLASAIPRFSGMFNSQISTTPSPRSTASSNNSRSSVASPVHFRSSGNEPCSREKVSKHAQKDSKHAPKDSKNITTFVIDDSSTSDASEFSSSNKSSSVIPKFSDILAMCSQQPTTQSSTSTSPGFDLPSQTTPRNNPPIDVQKSTIPKLIDVQKSTIPIFSDVQKSNIANLIRPCNRPPLKLKPKTSRGMGRGRYRSGTGESKASGPPPLVTIDQPPGPAVPSKKPPRRPFSPNHLHCTYSGFSPAPSICSSLGRGSATILSDTRKAADFGDIDSLSTRTPVSIRGSRPGTPDSAADPELYHDMYDSNVRAITDDMPIYGNQVITDDMPQERLLEQDFRAFQEDMDQRFRSPGTRQGLDLMFASADSQPDVGTAESSPSAGVLPKPSVSLCFAYDSDDPDNFL